ncbi:WXG100 family type VII secretion target [Peterkaempfera bronchialis]|uniref:ESAT-6-like protein n=1 Tax=Peterkaempfera bronchialis TaxID=2126346 RepID=A0A345T0M7_9ACTN|nr:WXG100 family type VII secretion target [Peterkaempfera bronchialis]AXI79532.1 hypothetical protein C7M71_021080 [Peterkaempfera bronchialis]
MDQQLHVDLECLQECWDELAKVAGRLDPLMDDLHRGFRQVGEEWSGAASERFAQYFQEWYSSSDLLLRSLQHLRSVLGTAHFNYSAARDANLRMWCAE